MSVLSGLKAGEHLITVGRSSGPKSVFDPAYANRLKRDPWASTDKVFVCKHCQMHLTVDDPEWDCCIFCKAAVQAGDEDVAKASLSHRLAWQNDWEGILVCNGLFE